MRQRSKTLATWLAVLGGPLGAHRFYLHGRGDLWGWLHPWPTLLGAVGLLRINALGQDDQIAWLLLPLLGLMIAQAMLSAIVIGLTPDERWRARFGPAGRPSGWLVVIGVVVALMLGGASFMGALAYGGQKYFEWQSQQAASR